MTVPMALVDFIPVGLFLATVLLLQRDLYSRMQQAHFSLLSAGTLMIFLAGFCKALWKLLYALNACDFQSLNSMFFPMQSLGFVLTGLGLVLMLTSTKKNTAALAIAPAVFSGTMVFVAMTILGTLGLCGSLGVLAAKIGRKKAIAWFAVAFVLMLGMGYLSSRDFADPAFHWMAEGTNVVGQTVLLLGVLDLHKHGLAPSASHRQ